MQLNPNILSLPPYLSTSWKNVSSLYVMKGEEGASLLCVVLRDGSKVEIPHLSQELIHLIFDAHMQYSKEDHPTSSFETLNLSTPFKNDHPLFEAFGPAIQHNPNHANLPPLPPGILKKITAIASAVGAEFLHLPPSEANCNCIYCQVMNAMRGEMEEEVTEEDLKFRNWEIRQTAEKLYTVTNPIDFNEYYNVFLGEPIGCTCGHKNCEHVRAVLST